MIFDTHAHYEDRQFEEDREQLLMQMKESGIEKIVDIGAGIRSTEGAVALARQYDFVYASVGIHPEDVGRMEDKHLDWLRELSKDKKVVAIGEVGLDYHYEEPPKEIQKKRFEEQLELAREVNLPLIIHSRDAAKDTLDIMQAHHTEEISGIIHCFSYGWDIAKIYLDMGFYLGIGGVITFNNAKKLKQVVENMPLERIVLETDAPYLTPVPYRGKRNSSLYLPYVVEKIAEIKGVSIEEVERITWENAMKVYRLE